MRSVRWLCLLAVLSASGHAAAAADKEADTQRALRDARQTNARALATQKQATAQAARAAAEAARLAEQQVRTAAALQQAEADTEAAIARVDELMRHKQAAEQRVRQRVKALEPLLPLIERLSLYPSATLLAVPAPPEQAVRGILVLQGLARQIEVETEALRRDQASADAAADAVRAEMPQLTAAEAQQKKQSDALDREIAAAHQAQAAAEAEAKAAASRAAAAAARMKSLRAVLATLEAQRRAAEAEARAEAARAEQKRQSAAAAAARQRAAEAASPTGTGTVAAGSKGHGQMQAPVIGVVVTGWGAKTDGGPATGLSYDAPPNARVVSPCGGRVVFADKFRSYGLLLIVDCGGGYHIVLAGFQRLDVKLGQTVLPGTPVGIMPDWQPGASTHRPALYVELRHGDTPINPTPWFHSS